MWLGSKIINIVFQLNVVVQVENMKFQMLSHEKLLVHKTTEK